MKFSRKIWRQSLGACCLAAAGISLAPGVAFAAPGTDQAGQAQEVDAATKQLMAANGLFTRGLFKLAADEYTDFLSHNANHPQATAARYALAVCRYRLREFDKAVEPLRAVLADPKFGQRDEALAVLGHCELSQGHDEQALAAFDELLAKYPASKHAELAALNRAQVLYLSKRYPEAAKACETYLDKYPQGGSRPDALYFLALAQRATNQNADAVATLEKLTQQYPTSAHQIDALLLTGQALEAQDKLAPAIEAYKQMLASAPETRKADALYSLGVALYKAGQYSEAIKPLTTLTTDFQDGPYAKSARLQLGLAELAAGKTADARRTLDAAVRKDPEHAVEARYGLAQCDIAEKHFEQARQTLGELINLQPAPANLARMTLDHAVCEMELGQFQPASDELEKLRSQHPDAPQIPEATYRQAFCLNQLGKYEQSHALCQQVAGLKAADLAGANAELDAENLFLLAKYPEAEKQFVELARSEKDDARRLHFEFRQGQCAYFAGDYRRAAELLKPVASDPAAGKSPELQQANLLLGDSLLQQGKAADAVAPLKRFLEVSKTEIPQAQYKLGIALRHGKDADAARAAFESATQGPADSPWVQRAWFERGQIDLADKKFDSAAAAFDRVIASNAPPEVKGPAVYQLGWAQFERGQYPQAAATWKQMTEKYPKDALATDAAFQQGVALRRAKKLEEAAEVLRAFASSHAADPRSIKARQLAAACLKDLGQHEQAEKMLASLASDAHGADADGILYDLAWAQRDTKDLAAAEATYQRLLSEHPDSRLAPATETELSELLYDQKKYDRAAALLEKVIADKSADPKVVSVAQYRLGWCYQKLNQPAKAAAAFAAYSGRPEGDDEMNASALLQAGLAFADDGKYDQAEKAIAQSLQKYPNQKDAAVAMLKLGQVRAELQNYDASAGTFRQFLDKFPKSEFAYRAQFGIGWALENQKQYDPARKAYERVIAQTNGETAARAQFQIGETLLAEGKFEQAVPALLAVEDVYKYPKWSARALFEAGRAFEQLKRGADARKQYTEIMTKYKDAPEAEMAHARLNQMAG